jgi:hypothetical protein
MPLLLLAEGAILGEGAASSSADNLSAILSLLFSRDHRSRVRGGVFLTNDWAYPKGICYASCPILHSVRDSFEFRPEPRMEGRRGTHHFHYRGLLLDRERDRNRLDWDRFSNRLAHSLADLLDIQPPKTCSLRWPVQQAVHRCQGVASCLCRSTSTAKLVNLITPAFASVPDRGCRGNRQ